MQFSSVIKPQNHLTLNDQSENQRPFYFTILLYISSSQIEFTCWCISHLSFASRWTATEILIYLISTKSQCSMPNNNQQNDNNNNNNKCTFMRYINLGPGASQTITALFLFLYFFFFFALSLSLSLSCCCCSRIKYSCTSSIKNFSIIVNLYLWATKKQHLNSYWTIVRHNQTTTTLIMIMIWVDKNAASITKTTTTIATTTATISLLLLLLLL